MMMEHGATVMEQTENLAKCKGGYITVCTLLIVVTDEEKTFETVVDSLLTEEYDVDYAFNTLKLKMLTDWPEGSRQLFDADLHHVGMESVTHMFV